jgi:hypothetical protein
MSNKKSCGTCEFCMPIGGGRIVCADGGCGCLFKYGEDIPDEFLDKPNNCPCYGDDLFTFISKEIEKEKKSKK